MLRRTLSALLCLIAFPAFAQTINVTSGGVTLVTLPTSSYAVITASNLTDETGQLPLNGKICFAPVDNFTRPQSFSVPGRGQSGTLSQCANVVNGAITTNVVTGGTPFTLPITSLTHPVNLCYNVTATEASDGATTLGGGTTSYASGYNCVQTDSTWCSTVSGVYTCNFDNYTPNSPALTATGAPTISIGNVTTGNPGAAATAAIRSLGGGGYALDESIPTGAPGPNCNSTSRAGECDLPNVNGEYVVDGTTYASCGAAITAALGSSAAAVTVDCRTSGRLGTAADVLGTFDPGNKALTLLLGPFGDYKAGQITLRPDLEIIGAGVISGAGQGTAITSSSTTNQPILVLPQADNGYATYVRLQDLIFLPAAGATTQDGADLECNGWSNAGMWYSTWDDVWFGTMFNAFPGNAIRLAGTASGTSCTHQFTRFSNVVAWRANGSANPPLYICGSVGNDQFYGGEYDAANYSDSTVAANVYIGQCGAGATTNPYSLLFDGTTMQGGDHVATLQGTNNIRFIGTHHEAGGTTPTNGFLMLNGGSGNNGDLWDGDQFNGDMATTSCTPGPCGYLWNIAGDNAFGSYVITHNHWSTPAQVIVGSSSARSQNLHIDDNFPGTMNTQNVTQVISTSSATLDLCQTGGGSITNSDVSDSTTITTITNCAGPGDKVTITAINGPLTFSNSGNLTFGTLTTWKIQQNQTGTYTWDDWLGKMVFQGPAPTGTGAAVPTGPTSTTAGHVTCYADAGGTQQDCGYIPPPLGSEWGSGADLNSLIADGLYPSYNFLNAPPCGGCLVRVMNVGAVVGAPGDEVVQVAWDAEGTAGAEWTRTKGATGSWSSWKLLTVATGSCTMQSGTCASPATPITLAVPFANQPACGWSWNGTGTLTGIVHLTFGVSGTTYTVTPVSSVSTDTAQIVVICGGAPD